jgi:DNA-binding MarR family transcriptional regulator
MAGDRLDEGESHDLLSQLLRQLTVEVDQFAEIFGQRHGLHRTDLNALVVIMDAARRGTPISPGRLAEALHLSASATTAVLDRLEVAGHVRRDRHPTDRRKIALIITDHARRLGRDFFLPLDRELAKAWAGLTAAQRQTVARFLQASIDATIRVRAELAGRDDQP